MFITKMNSIRAQLNLAVCVLCAIQPRRFMIYPKIILIRGRSGISASNFTFRSSTVAGLERLWRRSHAKVFNARDCCALVSALGLFSTDINARYSQIKTLRALQYIHTHITCPVWLTGYNNCTPFIARESQVHFNIFFTLSVAQIFVHTGGKMCAPWGDTLCGVLCVCAEKLIPLRRSWCFGKKTPCERKFAVFGGGACSLSLPFSLSLAQQHGSLNTTQQTRSLTRSLSTSCTLSCLSWWLMATRKHHLLHK